jgi:hypothetical protein
LPTARTHTIQHVIDMHGAGVKSTHSGHVLKSLAIPSRHASGVCVLAFESRTDFGFISGNDAHRRPGVLFSGSTRISSTGVNLEKKRIFVTPQLLARMLYGCVFFDVAMSVPDSGAVR